MDNDRIAAIQAVAERVQSWHYSSEEGTVVDELRKGFGEAGVDVSDDEIGKLVSAIEADKREGEGNIDVAQVLG
jgi:hypothetical protein